MKLKDIKFTVNKTISKDKKKKIKEELQAKNISSNATVSEFLF